MRTIARARSNGTDRTASGPQDPASARHVHRRAIGAARFLAHTLTPTPRSRERAAAHTRAAAPISSTPEYAIAVPAIAVPARPRGSARRRLYRRHLVRRLTSDRTLPLAIALIVLLAAGVSLAPAAAPVGAAQAHANANAEGNAPAVRLAVGGGAAGLAELDGAISDSIEGGEPSAYLDDGTLYKPVAVDTSIQSSVDMLEHYKVRDGDTLTGIASRFGVSMMTVWWANKFESKEDLKVGKDLIIPPVNGLVVTVKAGDTLETLATENKIDEVDIVELNALQDTNLIVGQVLVLPGAKGDPIPTPKPTKKPVVSSGGGGSGVGPSYSGGSWGWPVVGGGNYISQYFHYGHYGVDIAADYGSTVVSALAGTVVYAGWANTGCGYTVIIRHSSSLYTMYCHNSRVLVSRGESVSRREPIARVGSSGWATGPHVHFAVSIGYPHESGSYFVNPLRYY